MDPYSVVSVVYCSLVFGSQGSSNIQPPTSADVPKQVLTEVNQQGWDQERWGNEAWLRENRQGWGRSVMFTLVYKP
jgi:hypothetical protein